MVRCEDFYKQFKKRGNFCGKSEVVAKKVKDYRVGSKGERKPSALAQG